MHVLRTWTQSSVVELCSNEKKLSRHIQKVQEGDYDIAVCSYATLALRTHKVSALSKQSASNFAAHSVCGI
jgi:hypothetical protein